MSDRRTALITHRAVRIGGLIVGLPAAVILLISGIAHLPIEPVNDVNEATRVDAAEHISNHRCSFGRNHWCPANFVCYDRFDSDRTGIEIPHGERPFQSARCVTPVFAERYCGALETPETHRQYQDLSERTQANTILDCQPVTPVDFITDPATLPRIIHQFLTPVPDSDQYFDQINLTHTDTTVQSLSETSPSATDPETYWSCDHTLLRFVNTTYQPSNTTTTTFIANELTGTLNTTITATHHNTTLTTTPANNLTTLHRIILHTNQKPTHLTITSTNCPNQTDTTTHIPTTNPPTDLTKAWRNIHPDP